MKKFFFIIFIVILFWPAQSLFAGSFPNDAKRVNLDIHSGTIGTLLSASETLTRTILYSAISCDNTGDNHIRIGTSGTDYLIDTEYTRFESLFNWETIQPNTPIRWLKGLTDDKCNYSLIYTDYNLASSTSDIASSTPSAPASGGYASTTNMHISNIENIGYLSTTTNISAGVSITQGLYVIPFILVKLILAIIAITLIAIVLFLFFKRYDA